MITIRNAQRKVPLDGRAVRRILTSIRTVAGYESYDIGLRITTNAGIAKLNKEYRGKAGPTDILSFANLPYSQPEIVATPVDEDNLDLGDLVVSAEYVDAYCKAHSLEPLAHWKLVLVHGFTHLLGYDHELDSDFELMNWREQDILRQLK